LEDPTDELYQLAIAFIPFREGATGLLGLGTNGAIPQSSRGFHFEAEFERHGADVLEAYWLKVDVNSSSRIKSEFFLFLPNFDYFERFCSQMVEVISGYPADVLILPGAGAYRNSAQFTHNEDTLDCVVPNIMLAITWGADCKLSLIARNAADLTDVVASLEGSAGLQQADALMLTFDAMVAYRERRIDSLLAGR
jgi:hypothetical protein